MTLPAAARYTGAFAGGFAGFSVPGIEVYRHDCDGAPCEPCEVDEGETCRPHWVNRQDHGYLTRLNIARAQHPGASYGCPDEGLSCEPAELRTTVYGLEDGQPSSAFAGDVMQRRVRAEQIRQRARERSHHRQQSAIAGVRQAVQEEPRHRRAWGNHQKHNGGAVGIRYLPMPDETDPVNGVSGEFDCLIVAPGHKRCDFYEK